jgi:hypothetical protein
MKLVNDNDVVIDNNVYKEVVEVGIKEKYPDAYDAKDLLENNRIPIIPVNIEKSLSKFRDPGETSCFLLAKKQGICISSDVRANKKFKSRNISFMELDTFFYNQYMNKQLDKKKFISVLNTLKEVDGTSSDRVSVFLELISNEGGKK